MELVLSPGRLGGDNSAGSPFQNQEVREWSHVDRLTGMLEHARIETGRWKARHHGTAQAYGKVIDSRERNSADGNLVQKARRQVEVFQSQGIGGRSVQVVRASQWSSSRITDNSTSSSPVSVSTANEVIPQLRNGSGELTIAAASSANKSINGRLHDESLAKLSQVSRLCRQINEETINSVNKRTSNYQTRNNNDKIVVKSPLLDGRLNKFEGVFNSDIKSGIRTQKIVSTNNLTNNHNNNLKSTSNEDLTKSDNYYSEKSDAIFARDCKARRSLQIPKSIIFDIERTGNNEMRTNPEGIEGSSQSQRNSPDDDKLAMIKNDKKIVKSYVLGMEEIDSTPNIPKAIIDGKILFNGTSNFNDNVKDMKSEYLRPTPILLKPKSNTTVVHLNNKLFLDSDKNKSTEIEPPSITGSGNKSDNDRTLSRVQSLANRFSNVNHFPKMNNSSALNSLGKKQFAIESSSSSSRIESLINRSTVLNGVGENNVETITGSINTDKNMKGITQDAANMKPVKKVGFCKTEVHFAAESGKVNIVETDCKPPPSNRFRRRRKNSVVNGVPISSNNKNLPLIHFGDTSYEKYIFGQAANAGSFKSDNFHPNKDNDSDIPSRNDTDLLSAVKEKGNEEIRFFDNDDELGIRDGWRARLKTILQSEPPPIIKDENNDQELMKSVNNFENFDETIIDHSFKGSRTTTVNLGANVISKIQKHTNEGKCNSATISTGIQLEFNTRLQKIHHQVSNTSDNTEKIDEGNIINESKYDAQPYPIVVSTVSKIPRPLIQTQQSVLKSAHLVMNINRINKFNSIIKGNGSCHSLSNNYEKNENSLALKRYILSSLRDNYRSRNLDVDLVNNNCPQNDSMMINTMNENDSSINYKNRIITNVNVCPTPLRLKYFNDRLNQNGEGRRIVDGSNDGGDNQLQYSSGSEQADEEVRSYMLGSKIHRSYNQNKKFSYSRSITAEEFTDKKHKYQEESLSSTTVNETMDKNDSIDNIDKNNIVDDESDDGNDAGFPVEEICFEANRIVEKNLISDKMISESSSVVTSDNENNKVLMNIVTTHEPVIARVEESHQPETRRELIFGGKRMRSHSTTAKTEEKETIVNRAIQHSVDKLISSNGRKSNVKHKAKDHCDNKCEKEMINGLKNDSITTDPTYVNVFENGKKSAPIYENCFITRKNNFSDKKYCKKNIQAELSAGVDTASKSNCETETSLSNDDCEEDNFKHYTKSRDTDDKLATISENNSSKRNNRESNRIKPSKIRSKKIVRSPSSTSSIESIHRSSANEATKESESKPQHAKSTRSSRLRRVTSSHETLGKETVERYSSNDKKKNTSERSSTRNVPRSNDSSKNDQAMKNLNDSTRSKKPIEIVYQTAVFNMKNEKLAKSSKSKESKTPRYINDLICGGRPKRSTDAKHVNKGTTLSQQRVNNGKSASPTNRHWK